MFKFETDIHEDS